VTADRGKLLNRRKWNTKALGDICLFENGDRGKNYPSRAKFVESGIPFVNAGHLEQKKVQLESMNYISQAVYDALGRGKFSEGDLLFCLRGSLGKFAIIQEGLTGAIASSLIIVRPTKETTSEFIGYYFQSENCQDMINHYAGGTAQPNLGGKDLMKFEISIPPLAEQKQIVALLDQAFCAIDKVQANIETNINNAKELFQSKLNDIFSQTEEGWEERTLEEITSILGDGLHGTPKYTPDGDYYFINGNNLQNGEIEFKERTKRVSIKEYEKYKKNLTDRTVFVSINGTLGNVAFYNNEKVILGKSACYFNLHENINKHFIKYIIQSPQFVEYMFKEATGATIKNVSLKTMRASKVHLPDLDTQNLIVRQLDNLNTQIESIMEAYKNKLKNLEELKKSILQKAFTGQLTMDSL